MVSHTVCVVGFIWLVTFLSYRPSVARITLRFPFHPPNIMSTFASSVLSPLRLPLPAIPSRSRLSDFSNPFPLYVDPLVALHPSYIYLYTYAHLQRLIS